MEARSAKRPYPQQQSQESATPFMLSGMHALLFDDDTLAAFINSPAALLPWNGDQSLLIDRYDVRHLLQDLSSIRKRRPAPPLTDVTEEELNHERFRDLHNILSSTHQEELRHSEESSKPSTGGYQAVPFSYSVDGTENGTQIEVTHRSTGFHPPFPVPDYLLAKLPDTEKLHQIIAGTAKFVKEHGGQSEVLLKVKQGSNPMFGFLNVDHHLHEYYRFLVQHPELLQRASLNIVKPTYTSGEGLSLLGVAYGSGDEDDDRALRLESNQVDIDASGLGIAKFVQEGLTRSTAFKAKSESGGATDVQGKVVAASSRTSKMGDGSGTKVSESISKALPQANKKKRMLGELIQPNKRIVAQPKATTIPAKAVSNSTNQLPKKSESKTSSWHSVPSIKEMNYGMSADAAAAVVLAATRGARGLKQDFSNNRSSSSSGVSQKVLEANGQPVNSSGGKGTISLGLGQSDVKLAKAVAELAAIAASHEADSADTLLTPAEKLKAERLRKAKMFAAMIKSGKCGSESDEKLVEQPPGVSPAATSTKSDEMRTYELSVNGKATANGKGGSIESGSLVEEVEESDINKGARSGGADLASRPPAKERNYRSKELDRRSDSEDSDLQRKRKARKDLKGDKKHRHSRRRKHKDIDSASEDSVLSSGDDSTYERKSKTHGRHHKRKRSHSERDCKDKKHGRTHNEQDGKDGKHGPSGHKVHVDDSSADVLHKQKHRHRRQCDRSFSGSEDETSGSGRATLDKQGLRAGSVEEEKSTLALSKHSRSADDRAKSAATTEVPADIRQKVRAMLLSTL